MYYLPLSLVQVEQPNLGKTEKIKNKNDKPLELKHYGSILKCRSSSPRLVKWKLNQSIKNSGKSSGLVEIIRIYYSKEFKVSSNFLGEVILPAGCLNLALVYATNASKSSSGLTKSNILMLAHMGNKLCNNLAGFDVKKNNVCQVLEWKITFVSL